MKKQHRLSNIDQENRIGDCLVCGPKVRLKPRYNKQGQYRCYNKWIENQKLRTVPGVTFIQRLAMIEEQSNLCAICDTEMKKAYIDHCHYTGRIRAALCFKCNTGLGVFDDDVDKLHSAIIYLNKFNEHT